ncbi:unnamed protein product [Peniophora sp. CBMAI 1063]|nr:unnamed protein product [Peniophora sp. CBMAI 1063]
MLHDEIIREIMSFASEAHLPCPPKIPRETTPDREATPSDSIIPPSWTQYPELLPANLVSPGPGDLGSAVSVSHVCQRWRQLALEHATLWAHTVGLLPGQVDLMVSRSKSSPLHVMLYGADYRPNPDVVLDYFRSHPEASSRIHSLTWVEGRTNYFRKNYCSPGTAGLLTQCDLSGLYDLTIFASETFNFENTVIDPEWGSAYLIHINVPALVSASIHDTVFAFHDARNLTRLSLQMLDDVAIDDMHMNLCFNVGQLLSCLNKYKDTLEFLELSSVGYAMHEPDAYDVIRQTFGEVRMGLVHFSRLRTFIFRDDFWPPELLLSDEEAEDEPYAQPIPLLYASLSPMKAFFSFLSYPEDTDIILHVMCASEGAAKTLHAFMPMLDHVGSPFCAAARVLFNHRLERLSIAFYRLPDDIFDAYPDVDDQDVVDPWLETVFGQWDNTMISSHNRNPSIIMNISYHDTVQPMDILRIFLGDDADLAALAVRTDNEDDYSGVVDFYQSTENPGFTRLELFESLDDEDVEAEEEED